MFIGIFTNLNHLCLEIKVKDSTFSSHVKRHIARPSSSLARMVWLTCPGSPPVIYPKAPIEATTPLCFPKWVGCELKMMQGAPCSLGSPSVDGGVEGSRDESRVAYLKPKLCSQQKPCGAGSLCPLLQIFVYKRSLKFSNKRWDYPSGIP